MGKGNKIPSRRGQVEEKFMKPFALGWTREVVRRILTKNPTCDIYYFSPKGKKLRSLNELKSHLTDGLSPDCFSFKREILGVANKFESVRDAYHKKKDGKPRPRKGKIGARGEVEEPQPGPSGIKQKRKKLSIKDDDSNEEGKEPKRRSDEQNDESRQPSKTSQVTKNTGQNPPAKVPLSKIEREIVRRVMRKKVQNSRMLAGKKMLQESIWKIEGENERKAKDAIREKETEAQSNKNLSQADKNQVQNMDKLSECKNGKSASGEEKAMEKEEEETKDLKSIVQKNIGKYRRLREKQKLRLKSPSIVKKYSTRGVNNSRAESFLKNRKNYLKPLQSGWRRELVYRSNCSKSGIQADVYYFHPNGKKFRSSREISENASMIGGLSIEFFTFRKEAVGCGEPQEIIRSARIPQKH